VTLYKTKYVCERTFGIDVSDARRVVRSAEALERRCIVVDIRSIYVWINRSSLPQRPGTRHQYGSGKPEANETRSEQSKGSNRTGNQVWLAAVHLRRPVSIGTSANWRSSKAGKSRRRLAADIGHLSQLVMAAIPLRSGSWILFLITRQLQEVCRKQADSNI